MEPRRDERVFLVRMWRERETAASRSWRGSVHDVATGRRFYVTAPGEITDFITVSLEQVIEIDERPGSQKP
jgi:hypothetical protein